MAAMAMQYLWSMLKSQLNLFTEDIPHASDPCIRVLNQQLTSISPIFFQNATSNSSH